MLASRENYTSAFSCDLPVPHESMVPMRSSYGGFLASDWNTPSAIVERQILPRQTKSTEIRSAIAMFEARFAVVKKKRQRENVRNVFRQSITYPIWTTQARTPIQNGSTATLSKQKRRCQGHDEGQTDNKISDKN